MLISYHWKQHNTNVINNNKFQVENLVSIELAYINTKHPDFRTDASLVSSFISGEEEKSRSMNMRRNFDAEMKEHRVIYCFDYKLS